MKAKWPMLIVKWVSMICGDFVNVCFLFYVCLTRTLLGCYLSCDDMLFHVSWSKSTQRGTLLCLLWFFTTLNVIRLVALLWRFGAWVQPWFSPQWSNQLNVAWAVIMLWHSSEQGQPRHVASDYSATLWMSRGDNIRKLVCQLLPSHV